jgi:hypothetical protein
VVDALVSICLLHPHKYMLSFWHCSLREQKRCLRIIGLS